MVWGSLAWSRVKHEHLCEPVFTSEKLQQEMGTGWRSHPNCALWGDIAWSPPPRAPPGSAASARCRTKGNE